MWSMSDPGDSLPHTGHHGYQTLGGGGDQGLRTELQVVTGLKHI